MPKQKQETTEEAVENVVVLDEAETKTQLKEEKKEKEPSKSITIERTKLDALLSRIERLEATASKSALAHFDEKNKEAITKVIRMRKYDGKLVIGEKLTKNIVEKNQNGVYREDQELEITFKDGSSITLPYVYYIRNYKHEPGKCIGETKNLDQDTIDAVGDYVLKLRLASGEIIDIGSKFVN